MSIQIRSGDTLSKIAGRHNTTVGALLAANPQIKNPDLIYAGQMLNLPGARDSYQPAPSGGGSSYTVRPGDTLSAIGARFGVSYQSIASANGISDPNRIYAGQRLSIPGGGGARPAPAPAAPAAPAAPSAGGHRYTVQPGDTLSSIGGRYGVSYQSIAAANGISNPNRIYPGMELTIPGGRAPAPSAPVSGPGPVTGPSTGGVSVDQLVSIMPNLSRSRAAQLLPHLNNAMAEGGINTPRRQAAFLAQLAHESVGLTAFEEFASGAAYEGRTDLGNIYPGDGVRYKGRGPIQLTGRSNYRAAGQALGLDLEGNPRRASDPDVGFRIAVWFWNSRNLSASADAGNFDYITYRINGGYNGKASRDTYHARARAVLGA